MGYHIVLALVSFCFIMGYHIVRTLVSFCFIMGYHIVRALVSWRCCLVFWSSFLYFDNSFNLAGYSYSFQVNVTACNMNNDHTYPIDSNSNLNIMSHRWNLVSFIWELHFFKHQIKKRIGDVMVSVLASSQTKEYCIAICCFSTKHTALRTKSKDWLARNQDNVFELSDIFIRELMFKWLLNPTKRIGLVKSKSHHRLFHN